MRVKKITELKFCDFGGELAEMQEVKTLASILGTSRAEAVGLTGLLLAFAFGNATDAGGVEWYSDAIEVSCYWEGPRGALIEAFKAAGMLTGDGFPELTLSIAPLFWTKYGTGWVKQREKWRNDKQRQRKKTKS